MKTTKRLLWRVAVILPCAVVISCSTESRDAASMETTGAVDLIALKLQQCPLWTEVPEHNFQRREEITETYRSLAHFDTTTIRAGVALYLHQSARLSPQQYESGEKTFAFLRVVFQVPRRFDAERHHMPYETAGNPVYPDGVDLLWPFSIDSQGRLQLTGVAIGLSGPEYNPLADFDQMARHLRRRFHPNS